MRRDVHTVHAYTDRLTDGRTTISSVHSVMWMRPHS